VQGQLRNEYLQFEIETRCGHCGEPIRIAIDSNLKYSVRETQSDLLAFVPMVDFDRLKDPSIIDAF
jgi:hypothetical protein